LDYDYLAASRPERAHLYAARAYTKREEFSRTSSRLAWTNPYSDYFEILRAIARGVHGKIPYLTPSNSAESFLSPCF